MALWLQGIMVSWQYSFKVLWFALYYSLMALWIHGIIVSRYCGFHCIIVPWHYGFMEL
jgi:hypothetical protein